MIAALGHPLAEGKTDGVRMFVNRKQRLLIPVGLALLIPLAACAPKVFADSSALVIAGDPPPLPPPPKAEEPPPKPKRVVVTADSIVINEKIMFEYNKAKIKSESHDLLNEIVQVIKDNKQIQKISIEGHTDSDGSNKYNKKLSDKRAAAVMAYLTDNGVAEARLTSKGLGEEKPIAENDSDDGKAKNRRVEFIITEQKEVKKTVEVDPETGEQKEVTPTLKGKSGKKK
jgi:OOP family OmpA-OmpF porin